MPSEITDVEVTEDGTIDILSHPEEDDDKSAENPHTRRQLTGAAVAGGILGFAFGGPITAVVAAGASVMAVSSRSKTGEFARQTGEEVAEVGDKIKEFAQSNRAIQDAKEKMTVGWKGLSKRLKPKE